MDKSEENKEIEQDFVGKKLCLNAEYGAIPQGKLKQQLQKMLAEKEQKKTANSLKKRQRYLKRQYGK